MNKKLLRAALSDLQSGQGAAVVLEKAVKTLFEEMGTLPVPDWELDDALVISGKSFSAFQYAQWMTALFYDLKDESNELDRLVNVFVTCEDEIEELIALLIDEKTPEETAISRAHELTRKILRASSELAFVNAHLDALIKKARSR